jgi:hypothetical protein
MVPEQRGLRKTLAELPSRIVHAVPWAHIEPAGLGVGTAAPEDLDEREARERRERETWRSDDDAPRTPTGKR